MKIRRTRYNQILYYCPIVPPEVGGILGSKDAVIDSVAYDSKYREYEKAMYIPDVKHLNRVINQWCEHGISFVGLFHSHPTGQETLSEEDISYIARIFQYMPLSISELYFPIVIPKSHMISYKAINQNHRVIISNDRIDLVP